MPNARLFATVAFTLLFTAPVGVAAAALSQIGHRWVDLLAQFTGPALAASLAVLGVAAVLRLRMAIAMGLAVVALLVVAGWTQWLPARGVPTPGSPVLTVYSANLHVLNTDVVAIARSIAAADADVVVLIELGDTPAAEIDAILPDHPYRAVNGRIDRPGGPARSVIAGRRPLRDLDLRVPQLHAVGAIAETPLGPVTVAGVHMTRPWPYQFQWGQIIQARGLIEWRRTVEGPIIAAGDFNSVSSARIGRLIRSESGLIAAPGWPGTWPTALPPWAGMTIDQVYRSRDLALVDRRLGLPTGSDHRPVITRFVRTAPPAP